MFVKLLDEKLYKDEKTVGVVAPKYEGDAGVDVRAREAVTVPAGITVSIPLGLAVDIPSGYVGWLTGRSITCLKFGLLVHEGKIDSGYRGEIHAFVTALGAPVEVKRGERLAQLVVLAILDPSLPDSGGWAIVDELSSTDRDKAGLGSTGRT